MQKSINSGNDSTIRQFNLQYQFLSNFYKHLVEYEGLWYPTNEHAYQAAKTLDKNKRRNIADLPTPGMAKQIGRRIWLRKDWESVKDQVMLDLVRAKFINTELTSKLIGTGNVQLIEGNNWNDTYWGVCRGKGLNKLGHILMQVRGEIMVDN